MGSHEAVEAYWWQPFYDSVRERDIEGEWRIIHSVRVEIRDRIWEHPSQEFPPARGSFIRQSTSLTIEILYLIHVKEH